MNFFSLIKWMVIFSLKNFLWHASNYRVKSNKVKKKMNKCFIPVNTRHYLDIHSTFYERYGRQIDVKTTLSAYWDILSFSLSKKG